MDKTIIQRQFQMCCLSRVKPWKKWYFPGQFFPNDSTERTSLLSGGVIAFLISSTLCCRSWNSRRKSIHADFVLFKDLNTLKTKVFKAIQEENCFVMLNSFRSE